MNKYYLSSLLRKTGLIKYFDKLRFFIAFVKTYKLRKRFFKDNPDVSLPPAYFIYETFNLNYYSFYDKSIETAKWLVSFFKKYKTLESLNILDWGCGPGRIIRHLPLFLDESCKFYGTDYNKKYIRWCNSNIPDISFSVNQLQPPLQFDKNYFDIVYGISTFTHLSKEMHFAWFDELMRIIKPKGILFFTTHGNAFKVKLTKTEQSDFNMGKLVVKSNTEEGHRTFGAFQPPLFVKKLIGNNKILEHIPGDIKNEKPQQDIWIIEKV